MVLRGDLTFYLPDFGSLFGSELPWKCVRCWWNAWYVCNFHLPTLFGNQCKNREKSKGNYYVAKCVIILFHNLFFLGNDCLDTRQWVVFNREKRTIFAVAYFLGYVQSMSPTIVNPSPLFVILKSLRTLHIILWGDLVFLAVQEMLLSFLKALHGWLHMVVSGHFSHFYLFPDLCYPLAGFYTCHQLFWIMFFSTWKILL